MGTTPDRVHGVGLQEGIIFETTTDPDEEGELRYNGTNFYFYDGASNIDLLVGTNDHGSLDGASLLDDDHTQYPLLAGRATGQTLIGGTAAGEDLILQSTAHATRGSVIFNDEAVLLDDIPLAIGTSAQSFLMRETAGTVDSIALYLEKTSRSLIISDTDDLAFNLAHTAQTNPTVFIHAAFTDATRYLSLNHDGGDGVIATGTSTHLSLEPAADLYLRPGGGDVHLEGNTLRGNDTSGGDLTLSTTSNVTKGSYIFEDLTTDGIVTTTGTTGTLVVTTAPTITDFTNSAHDHEDAAGGAQLDHSLAMTAASLTTGDDHTQYAHLVGRSGGQVLQGDTLTGGDLTLEATAHATKGLVIVKGGVDIEHTTEEEQLVIQTNKTNITTKTGSVSVGHYTNAEAPVLIARAASGSTASTITFGGGDASFHAATQLNWYTTTTTTGGAGSLRMRIYDDGYILLGTVAASAISSPGSGDVVVGSEIEVNSTAWLAGGANMLATTLSGDIASGGDLTLESTTHGTKGNIFFGIASTYDEVNDRWGIGETAPTAPLDIIGTALTTIRLANTASDATQKIGYINGRHYTNAENDFTGIIINSDSGINEVFIGGGGLTDNAATKIYLKVAANATTASGSDILTLDINGVNLNSFPLFGDDASGGDLTLYSTSHATKGSIFFGANSAYDELNDRLGLGTTTPGSDIALDIVKNTSQAHIRLQTNQVNSTSKTGRMSIGHYTTAEQDMAICYGVSTSTTNLLYIGGGTSNFNACTELNFYTAANNTTTTGTTRLTIHDDGLIDVQGNVIADVGDPRISSDDTNRVDAVPRSYVDDWRNAHTARLQSMVGTAEVITASGDALAATFVGSSTFSHVGYIDSSAELDDGTWIQSTTATASSDWAGIGSSTAATNHYVNVRSHPYRFYVKIKTYSVITNTRIWVALVEDSVSNSQMAQYDDPSGGTGTNDHVGFLYSSGVNSGQWLGSAEGVGAAQTTVDLNVTVASSTVYELELINDGTNIHFYINGVRKGQIATATNEPLEGLRPLVCVSTKSTISRAVKFDRFIMQWD